VRKVISSAMLAPILKIYNPTGAIGTPKLKWVQDQFAINPLHPQSVQLGRLDGYNKFMTEVRRRLSERQELISNWNGNPPRELIRKFDDESERIYDSITGWNERSAKRGIYETAPQTIQDQLKNAPKDQIMTAPDGKDYEWDGEKWVQIS